MKTIIFRKVITVLAVLATYDAQAQMAISKTTVPNASISLDFASNQFKGLVLPYVEDKTKIVAPGTLIFDVLDKKVKYLKGNSWFDLSVATDGAVDLSLQASKTEVAGSKVSVGEATAVDGVLVLEEHNKAMVLPHAASPHLNIINPSAGMMVYDTTSKLLAVYNGTVWTFWGASD